MLYLVKQSKLNDPRILAMLQASGDSVETNLFCDVVRPDTWKRIQEREPGNPWLHVNTLYGLHEGMTALIVGSGASVAELNRTAIPASWTVFAVNRAWRVCPKVDYWCATDPATLEENADAPEHMVRLFSVQLYSWMKGKPCYMVEFAGEPLRWRAAATRPLYFNETTTGWAIHAAIRMGFHRIILLGQDRPGGGQWDGYVQPGMSRQWQVAQHIGVADRMLDMFQLDREQWYERPTEIVDASTTPYLPVKRDSLDRLAAA